MVHKKIFNTKAGHNGGRNESKKCRKIKIKTISAFNWNF